MSTIDGPEVLRIAHLARIAIRDEDVAQYARNLTEILHLVERMNQLDTDRVVPMAHPLDAVQRLRDDEITETNERDRFQRLAPTTQSGLYLVPKVID